MPPAAPRPCSADVDWTPERVAALKARCERTPLDPGTARTARARLARTRLGVSTDAAAAAILADTITVPAQSADRSPS